MVAYGDSSDTPCDGADNSMSLPSVPRLSLFLFALWNKMMHKHGYGEQAHQGEIYS